MTLLQDKNLYISTKIILWRFPSVKHSIHAKKKRSPKWKYTTQWTIKNVNFIFDYNFG